MKRVIFSIGIAALLCGCYNDYSVGGSIEGAQEFVATTALSRVSVESGEVAPMLKWEAGDKVGIFDRADNAKFNYGYDVNALEGGVECILTPTDASKVHYGTKGKATTYYAYYPFNEKASGEAQNFPVKLPRVQTQRSAGDISHLADLNFMMADPLTIESGAANLCFGSAFAFVKVDLSLGEEVSVPVKQLRLKSTSAMLSAEIATIDLTTEGGEIVVGDGSGEIVVALEENAILSQSTPHSFYLMALPGKHTAGTLTAEVVAVNNAVATVELPAVEFKANRYYTQSVSVTLDDFVDVEPFEINPPAPTGAVGEPVTFSFSGVADAIDLYTGEVGHDYEWKDTERFIAEKLLLSFNVSYVNGDDINPELLRVKLSNDYNHSAAIYNEEEIQKATWTDITDLLTLPTAVSTLANYTTAADDLDITSYVDTSKALTIGLFYRVTAVPEDEKENGHGRTQVNVSSFKLNSLAENGTRTPLITEASANTAYAISGESYSVNNNASHVPQFKSSSHVGGSYMYFSSMFNPPINLYGYMVTKPVTPLRTNLGTDTPIVVQSATDNAVTSYEYIFNEAGTYTVVIVGYTKDLTGETKETKKTFTITIE